VSVSGTRHGGNPGAHTLHGGSRFEPRRIPRAVRLAHMHVVGSPAPARLRPPLKWAGGKRWQVPHLRPLWERHAGRRLVEPFCGGGAVALGLAPQRALLNDANAHLMNFYRWLQRGLLVDLPMENDAALFYRHRQAFNALLAGGRATSREAAALFYYLNRTGFNGLCRFNRSDEFNVPFGRYARIHYTRDFTAYRELFAGWTLTSTDVERVPIEPDDFVYADPPYDVEFTQYAKDAFTWRDQERTAAWLAKHRGPVVLVNQATARIDALYRRLGYQVRFHDAPRRISRTGDRTPAQEIMATRNL
jgi:DNA adenine methylase